MTELPSQAAASAPPTELLLGRYRVLSRRGTGGFGTVCTCWDTRLQRRVAIKRMPVADNATTTAEEALAEARTSCMLAHPNIVTVFDFESDGTYAYLVMEYVDGLNLAELLARVEGGRLTGDEAAHVLDSVAAALSFAHENRVLHLDIKPTNIMIDRQGTVKLADFGMSTLASAAGYGDARGGTVGYMPPEQVEGMLVDERADIFALACVMWQALAGISPFSGKDARESLEKIFLGPRPPLSDLCPELIGLGEDTLLQALTPEAAGRTSSVDELADDLVPCLGSTRDGQRSLARLVDQAEEDDGADEEAWEAAHQPLYLRAPWAEPLIERGLTVVALLLFSLPILLSFPGSTWQFAAIAAAVMAAAAAAWPPLGSALAIATLSVTVAVTTPTPASFPLAAALAAAGGIWWVAAGRTDHLASLSLLVPTFLPFPQAAASLSGFALDPLPAALTGAASYLLRVVTQACAAADFAAQPAVPELMSAMGTPGFTAGLVGATVAALFSSLVAMRGSVGSGIAGQAVGLVVIAASVAFTAVVENDGIWSSQSWGTLGLALVCFGFMCFATVLRGPLFEGQEGEDR